VLDVIQKGVLFFARIACACLMAKIRKSRRTMRVVVLASAGADAMGVAVLPRLRGSRSRQGFLLGLQARRPRLDEILGDVL
jgi:hypothetical protein